MTSRGGTDWDTLAFSSIRLGAPEARYRFGGLSSWMATTRHEPTADPHKPRNIKSISPSNSPGLPTDVLGEANTRPADPPEESYFSSVNTSSCSLRTVVATIGIRSATAINNMVGDPPRPKEGLRQPALSEELRLIGGLLLRKEKRGVSQ